MVEDLLEAQGAAVTIRLALAAMLQVHVPYLIYSTKVVLPSLFFSRLLNPLHKSSNLQMPTNFPFVPACDPGVSTALKTNPCWRTSNKPGVSNPAASLHQGPSQTSDPKRQNSCLEAMVWTPSSLGWRARDKPGQRKKRREKNSSCASNRSNEASTNGSSSNLHATIWSCSPRLALSTDSSSWRLSGMPRTAIGVQIAQIKLQMEQ